LEPCGWPSCGACLHHPRGAPAPLVGSGCRGGSSVDGLRHRLMALAATCAETSRRRDGSAPVQAAIVVALGIITATSRRPPRPRHPFSPAGTPFARRSLPSPRPQPPRSTNLDTLASPSTRVDVGTPAHASRTSGGDLRRRVALVGCLSRDTKRRAKSGPADPALEQRVHHPILALIEIGALPLD
jgi:hypothetical protein